MTEYGFAVSVEMEGARGRRQMNNKWDDTLFWLAGGDLPSSGANSNDATGGEALNHSVVCGWKVRMY